ncbi:MAG: xylan 1,4-beta-xylosidase [Oscillospiraceae bacterium]|nr:xylan 1,4-beta-xylosidase [Oscillospiraceae bacterium]
MAKKEKRFETVYNQSSFAGVGTSILVDRETGVNYLFAASGYAGGLTPLLGADGNPIVTPLPRFRNE